MTAALQTVPFCISSSETQLGHQVYQQRKQHSFGGLQERALGKTIPKLHAELPRQLHEANVGSACSRCDLLKDRPSEDQISYVPH